MEERDLVTNSQFSKEETIYMINGINKYAIQNISIGDYTK
jgi:hypothetical protein